jgi:hypothetical protein
MSWHKPRQTRFRPRHFPFFFLLRKQKQYTDEFAVYPARAQLETNFWTGNVIDESHHS